jgi:xanthine dehydrogenase accessory factor
VDPRESFGNAKRFPHADEIVNDWPDKALERVSPDASTAVAVLTHDPRLDDPALLASLPGRAFYVGALGSKRTQEKRRSRLLAAGLPEVALARLRGPIGLPLGGRSPEEIALAILAQVVETRNAAPAKT